MATYKTSRQVMTAVSNGAWSSFMNTYAATSANTGATSGMRGYVMNGSTTFTATYSGTYYITAASDDSGSGSWGGSSYSIGGFNGSGNTSSKYFSGGTSVTISWSIVNSGSPNGDTFATNPVALAFIVTGPDAPPAPTVSISLSKNSIINNGTDKATLSWSASGNVTSVSVTSVSSPGTSGSKNVQPASTTTYYITASGEGGTSSSSVTLTVYQPPVITFSIDLNPIVAGQCTTLRWNTTGDANTLSWSSGGITNTNLSSNSTVCPTDDQVYTATVSGLGGSYTGSTTLVVYQIPTVDLTAPNSLDYGTQGNLSYSSSYSNTLLTVTPVYTYSGGNVVYGTVVELSKPTSAKLNAIGSSVAGILPTTIPYTSTGPRSVQYTINAQGSGGTAQKTVIFPINIDEIPDNILVPESENTIKDQDPVYTPDITIVSAEIEIMDIDIPVEIKSSHPIQVDVNSENIWRNIRQIP